MLRKLISIYLIIYCSFVMADGGSIGAGNARCKHWNSQNASFQTEIMSWMQGFATADNLTKLTEGRPGHRLELFTKEYLRGEINRRCKAKGDPELGLFSVLLDILTNFPHDLK